MKWQLAQLEARVEALGQVERAECLTPQSVAVIDDARTSLRMLQVTSGPVFQRMYLDRGLFRCFYGRRRSTGSTPARATRRRCRSVAHGHASDVARAPRTQPLRVLPLPARSHLLSLSCVTSPSAGLGAPHSHSAAQARGWLATRGRGRAGAWE